MSSTVTTTTTTTPPVAAPAVKSSYDGFPVKDNKIDTSKLYGFYSKSTLQAAQGKLDADVKAVEDDKKVKADKEIKDKADKQKAEEEANATPTWKYVVFFPYYGVKFALSAVASLFSKICSIFGYGEEKKVEAKVEVKVDPKANASTTVTASATTAAPAKTAAKA